uniref:Uncharacterized protein n=1 Tax=Falco tinnunculus TaxID=100819 RepID=A0A8C4XS49_FALTI
MAEDHSLADGDAAVDVAEGSVLLLPAPAHEEVLPDVAQGELLLAQLYHDGVGDDLHGECPHGIPEGGKRDTTRQGCSPLNTNALTGEALRVDHDVSFIQHERADLLHVYDLLLETPIQHRPRCPDDNLLLHHGALPNFAFLHLNSRISKPWFNLLLASKGTSLQLAPHFLSCLLLQ